MTDQQEKLIRMFVNREILTGVDGGLRRAVTALYEAYKESSGLGEPIKPNRPQTKADCYSFSETLGCRAEAMGGKCGCKMLKERE